MAIQTIKPDCAILSCAPEGVGPHGSCGDPLDPVGVVREHVDGLLDRQVMHMDLGVCRPCYQDAVTSVGQELVKE